MYYQIMSRPPRFLLSLSYYHIMTRGNNRNTVFKHESDCLKYLELVRKLKKEHQFDLFHYCLMPNHVHLLIQTKDRDDFVTFMKRINLMYFYYYKRQYGWIGHFWQDRYKSQSVGKDNYFIQCGKYIELNPVRAHLCNKPEEYKYSSYKYYSHGNSDDLITQDIFFTDLGKTDTQRENKYREMVIENIITGSYKKKEWGSKEQRYNEHRKTRYNWNKKLSL